MGAHKYDDAFITALYAYIRERMHWLYGLERAGLRCLTQEKTSVYIKGCPPPAVKYTPLTFECHQRFCPFCHARKVSRFYTRLRAASKRLKTVGMPHKVVQYRVMFKRDPLELDNGQALNYRSWTAVMPRHQRGRRRIQRRYFSDAYFGAYWLAYEPWYQLSPDAHGLWRVTHAAVALVPEDWDEEPRFGHVQVIKSTCRTDIAIAVAAAFKYPTLWVSGRARINAHLFELTHQKKLFTHFGPLRIANETE